MPYLRLMHFIHRGLILARLGWASWPLMPFHVIIDCAYGRVLQEVQINIDNGGTVCCGGECYGSCQDESKSLKGGEEEVEERASAGNESISSGNTDNDNAREKNKYASKETREEREDQLQHEKIRKEPRQARERKKRSEADVAMGKKAKKR
ncbi:hypothetical protein RCOM_1050360 [Ricinus communis]|uniref:Uncharacterized protein n=1 Tax=Ricinus communis TaxID=3988 RepID=B9RKJ9_RICCO|nr:hypothetical protein RCOM_1050360 [Ricinus communis]